MPYSVLKRWSLYIAGAIVAAWLLVALLGTLFEKKIGQLVVREVEEQLTTDLSIQSFDLSFIKKFPSASIVLQKVAIADAMGGVLLRADKVALHISLWSLIGSNISIRSIALENGTLAIVTDDKGNANYDIFKPSEKSSSDGAFSIEECALKNIDIVYLAEASRQIAHLRAKDATFAGDFSATQYDLAIEGNVYIHDITQGATTYLQEIPSELDITLHINVPKAQYTFDESDILLGKLPLYIQGTVSNLPKNEWIDLKIGNKTAKLRELVSLLPNSYKNEALQAMDYEGAVTIGAAIKGRFDKKNTPTVTAAITLRDGKWGSSGQVLKNIKFDAQYSSAQQGQLVVKNGSALYNGSAATRFGATLENFENPTVAINIDGKLPAGLLAPALASYNPRHIEGSLLITDVQIKGNVNQWRQQQDYGALQASGTILPQQISIALAKETISIPSGKLTFKDNVLRMDALRMAGAGFEGTWQGSIQNILALIGNPPTAPEIKVDASLRAAQVDVGRLYALYNSATTPAPAAPADVTAPIAAPPPPRWVSDFKAEVAQLRYHKLEARDFSGNLTLKNEELAFSGDMETMQGDMSIEGIVALQGNPHLKANFSCTQINVQEFFKQLDNFGQQVLTHNSVRGTMDANVAFDAYWDSKGDLLEDQLRALAEVRIDKGELVNFKMLESFSNYIKIQDLRHIKFTTLQNVFEIKNGKLYIPTMTIVNNALTLTLNGVHSFENRLEYNIKMNVGQVLLNRLRLNSTSAIPDAGKDGWFNLYYRITGTPDALQYKLARQQVQAAFADAIAHKNQIQRALSAEFGSTLLQITDNEPQPSENPSPVVTTPSSRPDEFVWEKPAAAPTKQKESVIDFFKPKKNQPADKSKSATSAPEEKEEYIDFDNF